MEIGKRQVQRLPFSFGFSAHGAAPESFGHSAQIRLMSAILPLGHGKGSGMKPQSFSPFEQSQKKKRTRRELFLAEMDRAVP